MATVNSNVYISTWKAGTGILPEIPEGVKYAQFFVTQSGEIETEEIEDIFIKGDWLIYIFDDVENIGHFYKATSGVITVSNVASGDTDSDPEYSDGQIEPSWYTKVHVNSSGKIFETGFLTAEDIPSHKHNIKDIGDISDAVWDVLSKTFVSSDDFAVKFDIDKQHKKISADVNIDGDSIDKNEFGQLYTNVEGSGSGGYVDTSNFITNDQLQKAVWPIVAQIFQQRNFERQGNVVFKVDELTQKITAEVIVDEQTIGTNDFGQLYSILGGIGTPGQDGEDGNTPDKDENDPNGNVQGLDLSKITIKISQVLTLEDKLGDIENRLKDLESKASFSSTQTIDISQYIDGDTLIVNKYGKLTVVSSKTQKHLHKMDDITDLPQKYAAVAATRQVFESDMDFSTGVFDFKGKRVDWAFNEINKYLKSLSNDVEDLKIRLGTQKPSEPNNIEGYDFLINGPTERVLNRFNGYQEVAYYNSLTSISFNRGIYPYDEGKLEVVIDNKVVDTYDLESSVQASNSFVSLIKDAFEGDNLHRGWYNKLYFTYKLPQLSNDIHSIKFIHKYDGKSIETKTLQINTISTFSALSATTSTTSTQNTSKVNGIPCYKSDESFISAKIDFNYTDALIPFNFYESDGEVDVDYKGKSLSCIVTKKFGPVSGKLSTYIDVFNFARSKTRLSFTSEEILHNNTTVEKYRFILTDNNIYEQYNSTKPLKENDLLLDENIAKFVSKDFSHIGGYDYSSLSQKDGYGEITLSFPSKYINHLSLYLEDGNGNKFKRLKNGMFENIVIDVAQSNDFYGQRYVSSGIIYNGHSIYGASDFGALDLYRTTDSIMSLTFGKGPIIEHGRIYLRIKLSGNTSLNIAKLIESVLEQTK